MTIEAPELGEKHVEVTAEDLKLLEKMKQELGVRQVIQGIVMRYFNCGLTQDNTHNIEMGHRWTTVHESDGVSGSKAFRDIWDKMKSVGRDLVTEARNDPAQLAAEIIEEMPDLQF